jgi:hypothetical protein
MAFDVIHNEMSSLNPQFPRNISEKSCTWDGSHYLWMGYPYVEAIPLASSWIYNIESIVVSSLVIPAIDTHGSLVLKFIIGDKRYTGSSSLGSFCINNDIGITLFPIPAGLVSFRPTSPHPISGTQCQGKALGEVMSTNPSFCFCDCRCCRRHCCLLLVLEERHNNDDVVVFCLF